MEYLSRFIGYTIAGIVLLAASIIAIAALALCISVIGAAIVIPLWLIGVPTPIAIGAYAIILTAIITFAWHAAREGR